MLQQQRHHQIALAGRVMNAVTGDAIAGARIKIIQAPDAFLNAVILKTRLFGLPEQCWRSPFNSRIITPPTPPTAPKIQAFHQRLTSPGHHSAHREFFQTLLSDSSLRLTDLFQALQLLLDGLQQGQFIATQSLERTQSARDGWFYFVDLPPGLYRLEAALPFDEHRYGTTIVTANIPEQNNQQSSHSTAQFSDTLMLSLSLTPTTLLGKITDATTQDVIDMATVKIHDSREQRTSSKKVNKQGQREWNYRFLGLNVREPTTHLTVFAQGYLTQYHQASIDTGGLQYLDFQLVPE